MSSPDRIDGFLSRVRRRINLRALASAAVWSLACVAAATLVVALAYVAQGYAVDRRWYVAAAVAALAATAVAWLARLAGSEAAARFADRYFGLQDSLISTLHFRRDGKQGGFYDLQEEQTAGRVAQLDPKTIDWRPERWPALVATALAAVAIGMALIGPSQAVQQRLELEDFTLTSTQLANAELKQLVQELNEQANDPLEREMIEPDKLREMVEALDQTKDQKEALRQYAKLEQQLNKQLAKLSQKKDEHLLAEAAKELEKARETKPLGEDLAAKKYDKASKELEEMKPDGKQLSEQQKQLAKLRAASKRMAAAVRNQRGRNQSGSPSKSAKAGQSAKAASSAQSGKSGSAGGAGGQGGGELGDAIQDLDESLAEWSDALSEAMRQEKQNGQCDAQTAGQCKACRNSALSDLDKLSKYLKRMAIKKNASDKLCKLCKACSQCQGGLCQSPIASPKNARGIGSSSNFAQRELRDELIDNGQTESLKGIKGHGPSQTTVETADEGTGTSSRGAVAKNREFRKQYESFVSREDVPEEVRSGVKQYFEAIHQIEE